MWLDDTEFITCIGDRLWKFDINQLSKGGPLAGIKVAAAEPDPTQVDSDNPRPAAAHTCAVWARAENSDALH